MDTDFNPYHQWLELDAQIVHPNYYQLLGVDPEEQNSQTIAEAADHATSKVRSCRPGPHAAQWANLIDVLKTAKSCLLDAEQRKQYDAQLAQPSPDSSQESSDEEPLGAFSSGAPVDNNMYPPGMSTNPASPQTSTGTAAEAGNVNPASQAPLQHAAQPAPAQPVTAQPVTAQQQQNSPPGPYGMAPVASMPTPQATVAAYPAPATGIPASNPMSPAPLGQLPAGSQAYYPTAAPTTGTPASNPAQPVTAMYPAVPTAPVAPTAAVPNPMDPMAPVAVGEASTQPLVAQPQWNQAAAAVPTTPTAIDPMAPVALAAAASPGPMDSVVPISNPNMGNATSPGAVAQPAGSESPQSAEQAASEATPVEIGGAKSNLVQASERRNQSRRTITTIAIGIGMFLLSASIIYYFVNKIIGDKTGDDSNSVAQSKDEPNDGNGKADAKDDTPKPNPKPSPQPGSTPRPTTDPVPMPQPMPNATPQPTPMPQPDPPAMPMPQPTPTPTPPPKPTPTPQEILALSQAMTAAREALANKNPEAAAAEIAKVESLTMRDEHKAMLSRLKKVTGLIQEFWNAVDEARTQLTGGEILITPGGNELPIVESSPEKLIIRKPGQNVTLGRRQESTKLAELLASRVLPKDDPHSQIVRGAAYVVEANKDWQPDGIQMWKAASGFDAEGTGLLTYVEDKYDFAKE